jgi:transcriptional regulator with XRE-family HTH domain
MMTDQITPMRYIRERIFRCATQAEFADQLGVSQAHISRMETGADAISSKVQGKVLALATAKAKRFDANWFFEVPRKRKRR